MSKPKKIEPLFQERLDSIIDEEVFIHYVDLENDCEYLAVWCKFIKAEISDGKYTEFYHIINEDYDTILAKVTDKEAFYIPYGKKKYKNLLEVSEKERERLFRLLFAM